MKYIAFPIDDIDTVMEICVGEVNRYSDMAKKNSPNFGALLVKAKWEGKVEALGEIMKFGTECNEIK
jgi:hypothetical protein